MTGEWETWLVNPTPTAISFDGYSISDAADRLAVSAWKSFQSQTSVIWPIDYSPFDDGMLTFGEANPNPGRSGSTQIP